MKIKTLKKYKASQKSKRYNKTKSIRVQGGEPEDKADHLSEDLLLKDPINNAPPEVAPDTQPQLSFEPPEAALDAQPPPQQFSFEPSEVASVTQPPPLSFKSPEVATDTQPQTPLLFAPSEVAPNTQPQPLSFEPSEVETDTQPQTLSVDSPTISTPSLIPIKTTNTSDVSVNIDKSSFNKLAVNLNMNILINISAYINVLKKLLSLN